MEERIERTALKHLIHTEQYARKVLPFLKEEYFSDRLEKLIFREVSLFYEKYNSQPTNETLAIELNARKDINDSEFQNITSTIATFQKEEINLDWLIQTTEKFCKDRAIHNAIMDGIQILDGKDKKHTPEFLPELLSNALSVSFDEKIGHDYIPESTERYDFYHKKEERVEFDLDFMNRITRGGVPTKTLNIALAGTGVGKTLFMCHLAAANLLQGKNVLYIPLEMAEERIAERIDSNLLNVAMSDLPELPKLMYQDKIKRLEEKTQGKLIIKEYPTASAHAGHFKVQLNELAIKKSFKPDVIYIDYLNLCVSSRLKAGSSANSYTIVKSIAEELRGLAVEFDLPIFSATQTTRTGYASTDIGLEDTSESFGLPATADFMFAIISTEELEKKNQFLVKQLKNRYNDPTINRKFMLGVDRSKMRIYDVEQNAQEDIVDANQQDEPEKSVFDNSETAKRLNKFSDFKI